MGTFFTIYKHFRDFVKWLLWLLLQIQHENNFLTNNKHQQAKVRHFSGISLYDYFIILSLKFHLQKMSWNEMPSWLRSQNSE